MAQAKVLSEQEFKRALAVVAKKDGLLVPRFMLFDIVAHPGCDGWPLTAAKREAMLRDLRKALPRNCGVHWVGDLTSLRSFLSTQRLPHEVGRLASPFQVPGPWHRSTLASVERCQGPGT